MPQMPHWILCPKDTNNILMRIIKQSTLFGHFTVNPSQYTCLSDTEEPRRAWADAHWAAKPLERIPKQNKEQTDNYVDIWEKLSCVVGGIFQTPEMIVIHHNWCLKEFSRQGLVFFASPLPQPTLTHPQFQW